MIVWSGDRGDGSSRRVLRRVRQDPGGGIREEASVAARATRPAKDVELAHVRFEDLGIQPTRATPACGAATRDGAHAPCLGGHAA